MGPGYGNHSPSEDQLAELSRAYTIALLTGDEVAAEVTIREALDARLTKAEIDDQIIAPALWYVGELWQRGEITIADEHLATEISLRVLALHREVHRLTAHRRRASVMLAAPSGERHIVALEMVADLLRDAGYRVLMLGADVPSGALTVRPSMVSVTMSTGRPCMAPPRPAAPPPAPASPPPCPPHATATSSITSGTPPRMSRVRRR